ncbi:hypothetical protein HN51_000458, partial [Arachis hypogaea]
GDDESSKGGKLQRPTNLIELATSEGGNEYAGANDEGSGDESDGASNDPAQ